MPMMFPLVMAWLEDDNGDNEDNEIENYDDLDYGNDDIVYLYDVDNNYYDDDDDDFEVNGYACDYSTIWSLLTLIEPKWLEWNQSYPNST